MIIALKKKREEKKVSARELAAATGISEDRIWSYERGDREPTLSALCDLADYLDISLDMLVRGREHGQTLNSLFTALDGLSDSELNYFKAVVEMKIAERVVRNGH